MALWLIPTEPAEPPPQACISPQELAWAAALPDRRAQQYRFSRAWMRCCLSERLDLSPDRIPLHAPPGRPPSLEEGLGFVSVAHTHDALALAWSHAPIGIDLERLDRSFDALRLAERFYCQRDRNGLETLPSEACRCEVLRQWLAKEAAIKWQRGSLARDLLAWSWSGSDDVAVHLRCGFRVRIRHHQWRHWLIAVADEEDLSGQVLQICLR